MNIHELKILIKNIIYENYINEIAFKKIKTKYVKGIDNRGDEQGDVYYFKTNSNNNYYVLFTHSYENPNEIYCNKNKLINYIHNPFPQNIDNFIIKAIHISFGFTDKDVNDLNTPELITGSTKSTNINEQYEVFGKLLYLIDLYKNENPDIEIYVAASSDPARIKIYKDIYNSLFSTDYTLFDCNTKLYSNTLNTISLYMIDNYNLK